MTGCTQGMQEHGHRSKQCCWLQDGHCICKEAMLGSCAHLGGGGEGGGGRGLQERIRGKLIGNRRCSAAIGTCTQRPEAQAGG